ncbi:MAG: hypothetical protein MOGMAGMI_00592 [Candidatus Omnitrophica bacterium]|nr:hypothetical protein [Candidatus Omnitrophota bacterium]
MRIDIEDNPNTPGCDQFVFNEIGTPRPLKAIRAEERGREVIHDITGVEPGGVWVPAQAVKINDSSDGVAYLITGGSWGIRLRPETRRHEPWSLNGVGQWGEPFKVYGSEADLIYAD